VVVGLALGLAAVAAVGVAGMTATHK
jgi:hypothetical protein